MEPAKRQLPRFPSEQKVFATKDIERLVLVKFLFPKNTPFFEMVTKCLLHGLCSEEYPNALYMVNDVCKKRYPRAFSEETTQGEDGYPVYRWRNNGRTF
jgi:hypothetical protein